MKIDKGYLEHLLNCLANTGYQENCNKENKKIIDKAWRKGMNLLHKKKYGN